MKPQPEMKFNCTSCGECCRRLKTILTHHRTTKDARMKPALKNAAREFPYEPNSDGSCPMLKDNQCSVYEDRPLLCDFKKLYTQHPEIAKTELEWYLVNARVCNYFIDQATIPEFRLLEPCRWE